MNFINDIDFILLFLLGIQSNIITVIANIISIVTARCFVILLLYKKPYIIPIKVKIFRQKNSPIN